MNRQVTKEKIQIIDKYMKRCLYLLIIRKMQTGNCEIEKKISFLKAVYVKI